MDLYTKGIVINNTLRDIKSVEIILILNFASLVIVDAGSTLN